MEWAEMLSKAVSKGEEEEAETLARDAFGRGADPMEVLQKGAVAGIYEAGRLWREGEYFLPDIVLATEAYSRVMGVVEPLLADRAEEAKGKILIGTVEGDAHDLGKNIVTTMLRCASYEVVDLGVDVPLEVFIEKVKELRPGMLGMGAYMSTTMRNMRGVIRALEDAGLRGEVRVIVGGAAVTPQYATYIGADGYAEDAAEAVELADRLFGV